MGYIGVGSVEGVHVQQRVIRRSNCVWALAEAILWAASPSTMRLVTDSWFLVARSRVPLALGPDDELDHRNEIIRQRVDGWLRRLCHASDLIRVFERQRRVSRSRVETQSIPYEEEPAERSSSPSQTMNCRSTCWRRHPPFALPPAPLAHDPRPRSFCLVLAVPTCPPTVSLADAMAQRRVVESRAWIRGAQHR